MKNADYWKNRFKILEAARNQTAETATAEIGRQFALAQKSIDEQIKVWYGRFAENNEISLADAKQWLIGKDLEEFRWDVFEYIKHGKQTAADPAFIKQLENASARFHISKLEALKLKTQSTLEMLYGNTQSSVSSLFGQIYLDNYYHTAFELQKRFNIGWDIADINQGQLESVLSKPWTLDRQTFSDRLWTQKQSLLNEVHTQLTQNMILGKAPDDAIRSIAAKFGASRHNAGRLVMTESAYFANEAQKQAFEELDVEQYEIVETLDTTTCPICGALDGKVFKMSDYQAGVTAPPFHPWCRGCTAPYFEDNDGKRAARDPKTNKTYYVPQDMTYKQWKALQDEKHGEGVIDRERNKSYNKTSDKEQYKNYKSVLGTDAPKTLAEFQDLKYNESDRWKQMGREYKLFDRIDNNEDYASSYREKLKATYHYFKEQGYELTEHALGRALNPKSGKGKEHFTLEDVIANLKQNHNYLEGDTRIIKYYNNLAVIQAKDTDEVISVVYRNKAKSTWRGVQPNEILE